MLWDQLYKYETQEEAFLSLAFAALQVRDM
jgi:hypothetical protein